jgi:magnesium transporter
LTACVVDKNNKLVGMITSDDVLTVLKEEAEEDALRLAGVGDEEITDGVITKTKRRFNWLLLNLFTAFLATYCISLFGATIEQMVVLAFLMPIVASMGGNAGMQTLAVTVRTLATNDLTKNNFNQNILKEFNIGILNGVIFAVISSFIVQLWFQDYLLSLIISISMILTMVVAGLFGIVVTKTLDAMAGSIFIFLSVTGTTIPNKPATTIVKIIEIEIINESK